MPAVGRRDARYALVVVRAACRIDIHAIVRHSTSNACVLFAHSAGAVVVVDALYALPRGAVALRRGTGFACRCAARVAACSRASRSALARSARPRSALRASSIDARARRARTARAARVGRSVRTSASNWHATIEARITGTNPSARDTGGRGARRPIGLPRTMVAAWLDVRVGHSAARE